MTYENRLPAEKMAALAPGDTVLVEEWPRGWRDPGYVTATVARVTATQIVVTRARATGEYVERYRKRDGGLVGESSGRAELVDPEHPRTVTGLTRSARTRGASAIDTLASRWSRDRDDLDLLRQLQTAIGEYLDAES